MFVPLLWRCDPLSGFLGRLPILQAEMSVAEQAPARLLLTTREAAAVLGLHRRTVERMCREGTLRGVRLGEFGNWRVPVAEIERLIESEEERDAGA
jgi:excisionase family DNA binding protein